MYKTIVSTVGNLDDEGDPNLLYYNADIINNTSLDPVGTSDTNIVRFTETRSVPLINNISNFEFSIIRFTMNGPSINLPIYIPTIELGQSDINRTTLKLDLTLKKVFQDSAGTTHTFEQSITKPIIYSTETQSFILDNETLPNAPINQQDIRSTYYWIYTYGHFCKLVNETLHDIIKDLQIAYTAYQATFVGPCTNLLIISQEPKIFFTQSTNLFSIYYDARSAGGDNSTNTSFGSILEEILTLSMNTNLFNLLNNFEFENVGVNQPLYDIYKLKVVNKNYTNWIAPVFGIPAAIDPQPAADGYWVMTQNYSSTSTLWSPISSIVFTSTLIPIYPEQVGEPSYFGDSNDLGFTTSSSAFSPIITDISLPLQNAHDYRQFIEYAPSAEYRMTSLGRSKQSLSNIDVQVFFKNRLDNSLYPIRMTNYSTVSLKIMFRKINKI